MDEDAAHTLRWPRLAARAAGYVVLAVVLYILSAGPVAYVFGWRSPRLNSALELCYGPLDWIGERTNLLNPIQSYYTWWFNLPGGPAERLRQKSSTFPASQTPSLAAPTP